MNEKKAEEYETHHSKTIRQRFQGMVGGYTCKETETSVATVQTEESSHLSWVGNLNPFFERP